MHIKKATLHGFKSYADTVEFGPFSKNQNAVLGMNGSGKSNFYKAIEFVLLDEFSTIRSQDRKLFIHEDQNQAQRTAYVEIVFDNCDRTIPIDRDEVSIKRAISIKKDEFFVNKAKSTRQDVKNLLESSGFSPSNGYYIARQGNVNALALMKDSDRLDLLRDIAGTKFYDEQRDASVKLMEESNAKQQSIDETISFLNSRLEILEEEKVKLAEYERLETEARAIEQAITKKSLLESTEEVRTLSEQLEILSRKANSYQVKLKAVRNKTKAENELLKEYRIRESENMKEAESLEGRKKECLEKIARLQFKHQSLDSNVKRMTDISAKMSSSINDLDEEISKSRDKIRQYREQITVIVNEQSKYTELDNDSEAISESDARDELEKAHKIHKNIEAEGDAIQFEKSQLNNEKTSKEFEIREHELQKDDISVRKAKLHDELCEITETIRQLNKEKQSVIEALDSTNMHIHQLRGKVQKRIPHYIGQALDIVRKQQECGKAIGPLFELISCDDELIQAVDAVARARIFNIIVEKEEDAMCLIEKLNRSGSGRLTVMPLECLQSKKPVDNSLAGMIHYDSKISSAIYQIFGKTVLIDSLEAAASGIESVTLEGDIVNKKGSLSGGYKSDSGSVLNLEKQLKKESERKMDLLKKLDDLNDKLDQIEKKKNELKFSFDTLTKQADELDFILSQQKLHYDDICNQIRRNENKQIAFESKLAESLKVLKTCEYKLEQCLRPVEQSRQALIEKASVIRSLKERKQYITKDLEAEIKKLEIELMPKRSRVEDDLRSIKLENLRGDLAAVLSHIETETSELARVEKMLIQSEQIRSKIGSELSAVEERLASLSNEESEFESQLRVVLSECSETANRQAHVDRHISELEKKLKEIGQVPPENTERIAGKSNLKKLLRESRSALSKLTNVNKKAFEQYRSFAQRRSELIEKKSELEIGAMSIQEVIDNLDRRKEEALNSTFNSISTNFSEIFRTLIPSGSADLELTDSGVSISVMFEGHGTKMALNQLSGGQKALVALSFIFAIQRHAPAPFYLLDEVDAALDPIHRAAVSEMIRQQAHGDPSAQYILTTFKPELLEYCDKFFEASYIGKSAATEVDRERAFSIVTP